jgi:hypothetical protein
MCLRVFGQVVVVLSSSAAIKDLLEKRGEVYSDRPLFRLHQVYAQSKTLSFVHLLTYDLQTPGWERPGSCPFFARAKPGARVGHYLTAAFGLVP